MQIGHIFSNIIIVNIIYIFNSCNHKIDHNKLANTRPPNCKPTSFMKVTIGSVRLSGSFSLSAYYISFLQYLQLAINLFVCF